MPGKGKPESRRPVVVDLFAGAGGMSLGFEQAGFNVAAAVEIDPIHSCIHHFNFPGCKVLPYSVQDLSGDKIRSMAGIEKVDVVIGGTPCQGFSVIGKRALDDPRNSLVGDFVRIVSELDADYFVFENVKGLTIAAHRKFLEELIETFEAHGYEVRLPWSVLNSASYGVPQDRKRLFLLGAKKGQDLPFYPSPSTFKAGRSRMLDLPEGSPVRMQLGICPMPPPFKHLLAATRLSPSPGACPPPTHGKCAAWSRATGTSASHAFGTPKDLLPVPALHTRTFRNGDSPKRTKAASSQSPVFSNSPQPASPTPSVLAPMLHAARSPAPSPSTTNIPAASPSGKWLDYTDFRTCSDFTKLSGTAHARSGTQKRDRKSGATKRSQSQTEAERLSRNSA